jgi:hypothetical protein
VNKRRTLNLLLAVLVLSFLTPQTPANATGPGDKDITFGNTGDINITSLFNEQVNVEKIATDSQDRIVVLASFSEESADNHILFRLNQDGSYDNSFGDSQTSLNGRNYILVVETSLSFTYERVDLEIDSQDRSIVLISGAVEFDAGFDSISFVYRFSDTGQEDTFGDSNSGTINLANQDNPVFFTDISLDSQTNENGFLVAGFAQMAGFGQLELRIKKFDSNGGVVDVFGNEELGETYIDTQFNFGYQVSSDLTLLVNDVRISPDFANGYVIAYNGVPSDELGIMWNSTGFVRLDGVGEVDENFATTPADPYLDVDFGSDDEYNDNNFFEVKALDNHLILGDFIFTDVIPDKKIPGEEGFLVSGTSGYINSASVLLRIKTNGTFDRLFKHSAFINSAQYIIKDLVQDQLPSIFEDGYGCYNQAVFKNLDSSESSTAIIMGDSCKPEDEDTMTRSKLVGLRNSGEPDQNFDPYGYGRLRLFPDDDFGSPLQNPDNYTNAFTQIEQAENGKILVVRGAEPTNGVLGLRWRMLKPFYFELTGEALFESEVTISRHYLRTPVTFVLSRESESATVGVEIDGYTVDIIGDISSEPGTVSSYSISPELGNGLILDASTARISGVPDSSLATQDFTITGVFVTTMPGSGIVYTDTATATVSLTISAAASSAPPAPAPPVIVYVAPKPVPYLRTLTAPQLRLKENKLVCTAGTYQTGSTLEGVMQPSSVTSFNPVSYIFNLLVGGIPQSASAITTAIGSASWDPSKAPTGSIASCSVSVSAFSVTNTDKSTENISGLNEALSTQTTSIATANADYSALLSANSKSYQKALVDNRTKWRSDTEKIRTDYYAERDRIKSLPSTKATRALSSAALKAYSAAIKKAAADYKASQPAALAVRDAANKAALAARDEAISKANTTYGTFIESIGYGVLIP